ncbi:DNA-binding response regulator [Deinococcus psychrotolerans]|uniref:DNA-binding response regulator n=1 Tax=Deinococcus psychrotolerans TaxID=2489213 RepID=A0A3G8YCD8_9DEIO|nr:response regulator transcription factor [Deinococcus psychrotolerans]AZI42590.1 DNA-binding response regulator [Deinococcus psychrotolerans]
MTQSHPNAPTIRLLLVDDHDVVRQGLKMFLSLDESLEIVGEARNGAEAVTEAARLRPDVVIMDLMMPVLDGVQATRQIRAAQPEVEVLALTSALEEHKVNAAIQAGASGYLLKDASSDMLLTAIHHAARGEVYLHPEAAQRLVRDFRSPEMREHLTAREVLILQLMARGHSNRTIAGELGVGEPTVKTHVSRILGKLELESRTQAALYALKAGIATLE